MSSVRSRLLAGFGVNGFNRVANTLIQIISVPVILSRWGPGLYGEWLLLNTIPTYFILSDIGFGNVAANEMTMLVAAGKKEEALVVFQSVWVLMTVISGAVGLLCLAGVQRLPVKQWMHIQQMTVSDVHKVVFLLILSVLLSMQEILFQGAFRCVGKYPLGVGLKGLISLGSLSGVCIAVMRGAGPVSAAVVFGAANAVGTGVLWLLVRRSVPWIRFGFGKARREVIYKLLSPAVSFLSFPISNALSLQGILVVIGQGLGPLGVLTFSTARTIARSALQVMELINAAVWPEMSAAFGANDLNLAKRLHRTSCQMSIALSIGAIAFISVFGARIWRVWTINKVTTDPLLLNIMLIQLLVTALWYTSSVVPVAVNRHQTLAKVIVASSVVSLLLAWGLMRLPALQLRGAAIALVVGNALNAIYVLNASLQMVGDNLRDFLASLCRVPRVPNLRLWSWAKP